MILQLADREAAAKMALIKGDGASMTMGQAVAMTLQDWMRGASGGHITSLGVFSDG